MRALDTNVVVRFLVADDPAQASRVREVFSEAERAREPLLVTVVVLLETIWVLASVYEFPRAEILAALDKFSRLPFLRFERQEVLRRLLEEARRHRVDLGDLCIGICGAAAGCDTTLTFDRGLARVPLFEVLGAKR